MTYESAFPIPLDDRPGAYAAEPGMTLRDYFAAKALGALINEMDMRDPENVQAGADYAYAFADAMLRAREPK